MAKDKILTPEQQERKDRLRFRLFVVLIVLIVLMVGYLIFEMVSVFATNNSPVTTTSINIIDAIKNFIK